VPGSASAKELGERLRLSRERLMASELESTTRAWRLWAACVDATAGYTRSADQTYAVTLASSANIKRQVASQTLRRFAELGVFQWEEPRHPGSRDARILELPDLTGTQSGAVSSPGPVPRVGPLQSNTSEVQRPSSVEGSESGEPEEAGTSPDGAPEVGLLRAMLERLTVEELHEGMACYAPTIAELYAAELERRNIAPRRRPAWLDT
jgi:hypothetical protein